MKALTGKFLKWLMEQTTFVRYFVIAILFHVLILFIMGSVKIVTEMPKIIAGRKKDFPVFLMSAQKP